MAIIGVSGKINSGKDTVGTIIQYLVDYNGFGYRHPITEKDFNDYVRGRHFLNSNWKIVKFADKLKDCVCIILGCTREQLEDRVFKETTLGEEWIRYGYANGFIQKDGKTTMNNEPCSRERYEEELRTNWQTAYMFTHTPRTILQMLGAQCGRFIHPDIWVNATIS